MKWLIERLERYGFAAVILVILIGKNFYTEFVHAPKEDAIRQAYIAEQLQLQRDHFDEVLAEVKAAYQKTD